MYHLVKNPFVILNAKILANLTFSEEAAEMVELRRDIGLNLKRSMIDSHTFYLSLNAEHSNIAKKKKKSHRNNTSFSAMSNKKKIIIMNKKLIAVGIFGKSFKSVLIQSYFLQRRHF